MNDIKEDVLRDILDHYGLEDWVIVCHQQRQAGDDRKEVTIKDNTGAEVSFTYLPGAVLAKSGNAMEEALLEARPDILEKHMEKRFGKQ